MTTIYRDKHGKVVRIDPGTRPRDAAPAPASEPSTPAEASASTVVLKQAQKRSHSKTPQETES